MRRGASASRGRYESAPPCSRRHTFLDTKSITPQHGRSIIFPLTPHIRQVSNARKMSVALPGWWFVMPSSLGAAHLGHPVAGKVEFGVGARRTRRGVLCAAQVVYQFEIFRLCLALDPALFVSAFESRSKSKTKSKNRRALKLRTGCRQCSHCRSPK